MVKKEIIKSFSQETGLTVILDADDNVMFSAREVHSKLYHLENNGFGEKVPESRYEFRNWVDYNLLSPTDETGAPLFTSYRQRKIKNQTGRPSIDYLVDEETAKILIVRSNTVIGFGLLKRVLQFEKEYSSFMKQRLAGRVTFLSLTDSIKKDHDPLKLYHFSNEVNMIYRIMFGMDAKQLKEHMKVPDDEDLRDYFSPEELRILQRLEMKNAVYIDDGMEYQERKKKLTQSLAELGRAIEG